MLERRIRQHNISSKDMLKGIFEDQWEKWYWARTHDMPAMIRYLDDWATAALRINWDRTPFGLPKTECDPCSM
ncbi:hypothetical protein TNCV_1303751 [Trichonephila clavipes]|nr:hypothetical protein TNCV_1303751 [Trichonephila clavipes]